MSTENYPSDDRTFPRNWTNFKKTLTWPKRMYLGWLGDGTKYDDVQSFLNAELPDEQRWWVEHQMYRSEVIHIYAKLVDEGTKLVCHRVEDCPDPATTRTNRPKYELGAPLFDLMCHVGRMHMSRNTNLKMAPEVGRYGTMAQKDESYKNGLWLIEDGENYYPDDLHPGTENREDFFTWCNPEYNFTDTFDSLFEIDKDKHLVKLANPTYMTFIHDNDFDVLKYQEENDLAIRFGGKYQIDGKTYTTWRMKKVGQGQGHYTWTDIPAGKVGGEEQRCHGDYKDKSTLPFQDAQWFPGLIGHVNDRGNDENYVYEPITEKNEIPSNFSDYEDKIFPDWAPKR